MTLSRAQFFDIIERTEKFTPTYADDVLVRIAHHSSAIEGNTLTLADTVSLLIDERTPSAGKPLRELYEVANHREAFASAVQHAFSGEPLTTAFVRQIHGELMDHILEDKGKWKASENIILGAKHDTAPPSKVPWLMEQWVENASWQASNLTGPDVLLAIADAHIDFERIHPFADGNGRTGRMLIMWQALRALATPIIIEVGQRPSYIGALQEGDRVALTQLLTRQYLREQKRMKAAN